jgi:hypothetical protein
MLDPYPYQMNTDLKHCEINKAKAKICFTSTDRTVPIDIYSKSSDLSPVDLGKNFVTGLIQIWMHNIVCRSEAIYRKRCEEAGYRHFDKDEPHPSWRELFKAEEYYEDYTDHKYPGLEKPDGISWTDFFHQTQDKEMRELCESDDEYNYNGTRSVKAYWCGSCYSFSSDDPEAYAAHCAHC